MSLFWPLVIVMLTLAVASILLPLWRSSGRHGQETEIEDASLAIYQQRLRELESDQATGALDPEQASSARVELERELLREHGDEIADQNPASPARNRPGLVWSVLVVLLMPALALGLYYQLGSPRLANGTGAAMATTEGSMPHGTDAQSIAAMIDKVRAYLAQHPDDLKGWLLLGRTYMSLKRYSEAATTLKQAYALKNDDPDILLRYADALAMNQGGSLLGQPEALIHRAVTLSPENHTALWLEGMVALERQDHSGALKIWHHLLPMLTDADERREVQQMIAKAQVRSGGTAASDNSIDSRAQASPAAAIEVQVRLAKDIAKATHPDDTLFVYARAVSGPPMPLAIVRKQVHDLPLMVTLTDAMAMAPGMRLSKFKQVRVTARISHSGNAMPQSGDLYGEAMDIPVAGGQPVQILIDRRLP